MRIQEIRLYRVDLPLSTPYRLSYRIFETFEPILVEVRDDDGRVGWGEQHISPGSSEETRAGGWAFAKEMAESLIGAAIDDALARLQAEAARSKVAATSLATALEMLARADALATGRETRLPLLTPLGASDSAEIAEEVERRLEEGYRTFKIKVGMDVACDLARVASIQAAVAGRATLRLDANRAYSRAEGIAFAAALDPRGIELFEQPCAATDWQANADVARASTVPLMLDEPICAVADIDRAAEMQGVGFCKLKLKRFVSLADLEAALRHVQAKNMEAVLGDGLGGEINCWMEACAARRAIDNAGEFNGWLKIRPEMRLLSQTPGFDRGSMVLPKDYWPQMDYDRLGERTLESIRFGPTQVAVTA